MRNEKINVPDIWEDNNEVCTKRNEENRAKNQAGAGKKKCGKKQLDKCPKEKGPANNSEKRRDWVKEREEII